MSDFKVGDVVKLRNGGPAMRVESVWSDSCECLWYDSNCEVKDGCFPQDSMTKLASSACNYEDSLEKFFRF